MTYVMVEWGDAFVHHGTATLEECMAFKPLTTISVGHLICQTEHGITIILDHVPEDDYRDPHFIPLGMVIRVVTLT